MNRAKRINLESLHLKSLNTNYLKTPQIMTTEKTQEEAAKLRQEKLKALEATLGNIEKKEFLLLSLRLSEKAPGRSVFYALPSTS